MTTTQGAIRCAECCAHGDHRQGYHVCPACLPSLPLGSSVRRLRLRVELPQHACEDKDEHTCECGTEFYAGFDHADDEMCDACDAAWHREQNRMNAEFERDTR